MPVKGNAQQRKDAAINTGHDASVNGSIRDNRLLPLLNTVSYNIIIIMYSSDRLKGLVIQCFEKFSYNPFRLQHTLTQVFLSIKLTKIIGSSNLFSHLGISRVMHCVNVHLFPF